MNHIDRELLDAYEKANEAHSQACKEHFEAETKEHAAWETWHALRLQIIKAQHPELAEEVESFNAACIELNAREKRIREAFEEKGVKLPGYWLKNI